MSKKKKRKQFEKVFWDALFHIDVPAHLNELPSHLNHVRMRLWDRVTDEHLEMLASHVKSINMLDLDETDITIDGIAHLIQMENITELRLKGIRELDNRCVEYLNKIKGLELLHIRGTSINLDGALQLVSHSKLKRLLISDDEDEPAQERIERLRNLMPDCEINVNRHTYPALNNRNQY